MSANTVKLKPGPIGVFDSGIGGLTILKSITKLLPQYDYIYFGDNARVPYGTRSYETVYEYTLECVTHLFNMGCNLIIIACNTASAKALRTIQQKDLLNFHPQKRALGVIRPTAEIISTYSKTKHIGLLATTGTVTSNTFELELQKIDSSIKLYQQACPMLVPLIENNEHNSPGIDYFLNQYITELLNKSELIDTIALACTHYPLIEHKIKQLVGNKIKVIAQGELVANSLNVYLQKHLQLETLCSKNGTIKFFTTDDVSSFEKKAFTFFNKNINASHFNL